MTSICARLRSKASRTTRPRGGEVEAWRPRARLGALAGGDDPRYPVDTLLPAALREQVPDTGLEDEAERVEAARDDGRALAVADVEPVAAPERSRDHRQVRDAVLLAKPAARVDVEEPRGPAGPLLQLRGQRREELQPGRGQLAAESELGRRPDEERLRLGGIEPGQLRPVAALEPVAAGRAADGDDRDAGVRERLRVALHRPLRDLEPLGELGGGQLPSRLQHEQERDETACTHSAKLFHEHDRRWRECPLASSPQTRAEGGLMSVQPVPEGYHTLIPYLAVDDAAKAIEYYKKAFGAKERVRMDGRTARSATPSSRSETRS